MSLSLRDALATDQLEAFIIQADAQGVGHADRCCFDKLVGRATASPPED